MQRGSRILYDVVPVMMGCSLGWELRLAYGSGIREQELGYRGYDCVFSAC